MMAKKVKKRELLGRCKSRDDKFFAAFAQDLLAYLGNKSPSKGQFKVIEDLLAFVFLRRGLYLDSRLSECEKRCLQFSAMGMSNSGMADFFQVTKRQVERYRQSIFEKLGCTKITQAIAIGMRYDLISPEDMIPGEPEN